MIKRLLLLVALAVSAQAEPIVLSDLGQPLTFSYLNWKDKVQIQERKLIIRGVNSQGGAGCNQPMNLSGKGELTPALRLKVGPANEAGAVMLLLVDKAGTQERWRFQIKGKAVGETVLALPDEGAVLSGGNVRDAAKPLDLANIAQWHIGGEFGGGKATDMEIEAILLVSEKDVPELAAAREAKAKQAEAEKQRRMQEIAKAKDAVTHTEDSPWVESVYTVAPDMLAVRIQAQEVTPAHQEPFVRQPGDAVSGEPRKKRVLKRGGKDAAYVIGPQDDTLSFFQGIKGDPLLEPLVTLPETYRISSADDADYRQPVEPEKVFLKSKPTNWAQPINKFPMRYVAYLKLARPLKPGKTYNIDLSGLNVREPRQSFAYIPEKVWSEAVHVAQIGFRPDDPVKRGFASVWLGTGGALSYPAGLKFQVVEDATGKPVYEGKLEVAKAADENETMWSNCAPVNWNKTSVYRFDFEALRKPGVYRVCVEGVGSSYPFEIAADVWQRAFVVQMKGFYNQRSGIKLGPPYSDFVRPRDHHPADGIQVWQSTFSELGDSGVKSLAAGKTDVLVPEAWGGYHDAGDWNPRRITHMQNNTDLLLELLEMFPGRFDKVEWKLPPDYPSLPPMLNEILFEVDCFRRLQMPHGGVRFGIETEDPEDPIAGEVSWNQSMHVYAYAPDPNASFIYAAVAARAAKVLERYDKKLAGVYKESALKAMAWAEPEWQKVKDLPAVQKKRWRAKDNRNFAAIEVYRLTGDKKWHDLFLEDTVLKDEKPDLFRYGKAVQQNAAFAYALLPDEQADPQLKKKAAIATEEMAGRSLAYAAGNAFNLTTPDRGRPQFQFFYTVPDVKDLVRAHFLTGNQKYLAGAVQAALFPSGANPMNATFTVGVGRDYPRNPLKVDALWTGQKAPLGQTVFGNCDFIHWKDNFHTWPMNLFLNKICQPNGYAWPIPEAFFDVFLYVAQDEYVVEGFGANAFAWGYLAARP